MTETRDGSARGTMTEYCEQYAQLMAVLSRRWTGIILRVLMAGPHRFNQVLAAVPGLSDPLLTQRLREMETKGLVRRRVMPESPVRVEYELTEPGRDLEQAVRALSDWASKWWPPGARGTGLRSKKRSRASAGPREQVEP